MVAFAQPYEVKLPHAPDNNCKYGEEKLDPVLLKLIVGNADGAINLYQTSAPGVPEQVEGTTVDDAVAPDKVPLVLVHVVEPVNQVALLQLSFEGGPERVIVKFLLAGIAVGSLITYILRR